MLDYIYQNQAQGLTPIGRLIDRFYLNAIGWRGIRLRRLNLQRLLRVAVEYHRRAGEAVHILDIASGPGRYVLETIADMHGPPISAHLRDYQQANVDAALHLAAVLRLDSVTASCARRLRCRVLRLSSSAADDCDCVGHLRTVSRESAGARGPGWHRVCHRQGCACCCTRISRGIRRSNSLPARCPIAKASRGSCGGTQAEIDALGACRGVPEGGAGDRCLGDFHGVAGPEGIARRRSRQYDLIMSPGAKPSLLRAALTSAALCALFLVVYGGTNTLASLRTGVPSLNFAWESSIPVVPLFIIPYLSSDLFFVAAPFLALARREISVLAAPNCRGHAGGGFLLPADSAEIRLPAS